MCESALTMHFGRRGSQSSGGVGSALWKDVTNYIPVQILIFGLNDDVCNEDFIITGSKVMFRWLLKF